MKWAAAYDFQQFGILTNVDSDEPVQPPGKLRKSTWCSVSSLTLVEYSNDSQRLWSDWAYIVCAGWSEPLHVAHTCTTLLEISCTGSNTCKLTHQSRWQLACHPFWCKCKLTHGLPYLNTFYSQHNSQGPRTVLMKNSKNKLFFNGKDSSFNPRIIRKNVFLIGQVPIKNMDWKLCFCYSLRCTNCKGLI